MPHGKKTFLGLPGLAALLVFAGTWNGWALEFDGFADVSFQVDRENDTTAVANNGAFKIGSLDFFVAQAIQPRLDVLAEVVFEEGIVDLERLQIGYLFSDALKVHAGRFHTPFGYWNAAYHHGVFLHIPIGRPFFLRFEDDQGILPVHSVGVSMAGRLFLPLGEISYGALVGNGSSIAGDGAAVLEPNVDSDPNKNKAVGLRVALMPTTPRGWTAGASFFRSRVVSTVPTLPVDVDQTILAADVTKTAGPLEILAEYYLLRNRDRVGGQGTTTSHFYYVQIGHEFRTRTTPYVRHEQTSLEEDDPYLEVLSAADTRIETAGVRIRIGEGSAIKFEARLFATDGTDHHQEYGAQWAFAF